MAKALYTDKTPKDESETPQASGPIVLKTKDVDLNEERKHIFTIDDTEYTIPAKPKVNLALKYLWMIKTGTQEEAIATLLVGAMGDEAYQALMNYDDLEEDDFSKIVDIVLSDTLGAVNESMGK